MEDDDACELTRTKRGEQARQELADEERSHERPRRRTGGGLEEQPPAESAKCVGRGEDGERRREPDGIALAKGVEERVEVDVAEREVCEDDRRGEPGEQKNGAKPRRHDVVRYGVARRNMTTAPTEASARRSSVGAPMTALVRAEPGRRRDVVLGIFTALAALVIACVGIKVWRGDLDVPFAYREETQYYLMLAKAMDDHGGYFENPSLGAPFGQELYDYAVGTDRLNLDLLRLLEFVFGGAAAAVNLFFLLTFPLAAAAAFLVFRLLGIARAPAVLAALLFALLPYHFERGEGNLFLTAYWVVPLGAYLVLATLGGDVVLGGAGALALLVGVVLIHLSPSIAYRSSNGANELSERHWRESELYALKLSDLVFPIDLHRLEPLARFTADYKAATMIRSEPMALGPVAAARFLALLIAALV